MSYTYIPTPDFERSFKKLFKKYKSLISDYQKFTEEFEANPNIGADLGGGYRKVRMQIKDKAKGKSGGARIILYDFFIRQKGDKVILVDIYDKSVISSIKEVQYLRQVKQFIEEIKSHENKEIQ